jgi:uncharacterized protein
MYKKSYYNFKKEVKNGDVVLYNSKTGSVVTVERENAFLINNILDSSKEFADHEYFEPLFQNGFIVNESFDEYTDIKSKYDSNFFNERMINIVILPAETCNFTCPYCFIYNYKNKIMSDSVYDNIIQYIHKQIELSKDTSKKKLLKIAWFGGEPLLKKEKIISFMDEIHKNFDDSCKIISSVITNGYELNFNIFKQLLNKGISSYQVTFDGAKENHDQLRKLKNGQGSYDVIIQNLKEIVQNLDANDDFTFALRINFLKNTYKKIDGLIDELFTIIGQDQRFQIYCRPIYNFDTKRDDINEVADNILSIADGLDIQNAFTQYIAKKSYQRKEHRMINDYLPLPTISWCAEDNMYSTIIGSDGSIYICDSLVGDENVSIGTLQNDGTIEYTANSQEWRKSVYEFTNFDTCKSCKCLPICVGGCKRERIEGSAKPCLWTEDDILESMENYYLAHCSN